MVWLPREGQVFGKFPARKGNRRWLHESVGIRCPELERDRWRLPRSCLNKLVMAALDRYGCIALVRDMSRLSRCNRACQRAVGYDCDCSCHGAHHGVDSAGWFELGGDVLVADLGETKRTLVQYRAPTSTAATTIYRGELRGRRYSLNPADRVGWPVAAQFMCAACLSVRAHVWDHCHTHGFVRAPLCNTCNTRHWGGWHPRYGRATPSDNIDDSYYQWCPSFNDEWEEPCSA